MTETLAGSQHRSSQTAAGSEATSRSDGEGDVAELLRRADTLTADALLALWRGRVQDFRSHGPEVYARVAARLLELGAPFFANEVLTEGLEHWPRHVRLRELRGLALARCGLTEQANAVLTELRDEGVADEETLGMLARTHKDLALMAADPGQRVEELRRSHQIYAEAYRLCGGYWSGINAATTALLLGNLEPAQTLAREVRARCLEMLQQSNGGDTYWLLATLGEAALVLQEWSEAEAWYGKAGEAGRQRVGDLNSTRRNACLLLEQLGRDTQWIERCLSIPRVVVFAGHMIDQPGRAAPRFPPQLERPIFHAILERLRRLDGRVGFASAAAGADILFHEAVRELQGETHVVLPYEESEFVEDSVEIAPGPRWGERFARVLEHATEKVVVSGQRLGSGGVSYSYANSVLDGLATIRARELETELVVLAVWDGKSGDGPGGTETIVRRWQQLGHEVELIDLSEIRRQAPTASDVGHRAAGRSAAPRSPHVAPELDTEIVAMMFADVVKYSQLPEQQIPLFLQNFLGAIADLLRPPSPYSPAVKNTWGDGLFLVFESIRQAGLFALDVCEMVNRTDWAQKGLRADLNLRIGLHAGPVYRGIDPITGQPSFSGTQVSRAARIEPITPPGQVYASQAFAALAALEPIDEFCCQYVKQVEWAKHYGTFPTYLVRRR